MHDSGVPSGRFPMRAVGSRPAAPVQLDEMSKAIIEKLQQDGRRSYAGIGKSVGLSEAAVRQRVQRLVDSGVMQIVAVTDPMQMGFTEMFLTFIVGISFLTDRRPDRQTADKESSCLHRGPRS